LHHPIQLVRPDIPFFADESPPEACATRQRLLAQCADNEAVQSELRRFYRLSQQSKLAHIDAH